MTVSCLEVPVEEGDVVAVGQVVARLDDRELRAQLRSAEASMELARANLRFVVSIAKEYAHYGVPLEDLINEGNLGLLKAAQRFDETRGYKLIS